MIILLSNDDGIHADGIAALEISLRPLGDIYTVAPEREQSATSHALTLHRPLRARELAPRRIAVDGTPTDCVKLALTGLLPVRPDLIVAGINRGPNLGDDMLYSGTVSAAVEGALLGVPAIAVSLAAFDNHDFRPAAQFTTALIERLRQRGIAPDLLLNVNVPPLAPEKIKGWRFTRQGKRHYSENIVERVDPRGKKYYWIGGDDLGFTHDDGTDCVAIHEGYVSVTPLQADMTNYELLRNAPVSQFNWP